YPAAGINFRLGKGIKLIGAFGVLHGVNEWIGMFLLGRPPQDFFIVRIIQFIILPLSFVCLLMFSARYYSGAGAKGKCVQEAVRIEKSNKALRETADKLGNEKGFIQLITDNISEGLMLLTVDFKIIWVNRAAKTMSGLEDSDMIGKECYKVTHKLDVPCHPPDDVCPFEETVRTGEPAMAVHTHYGKNGEKTFVEVTIYPLKNSAGEIDRLIHVTRDITERVKIEETLKRQINNLEKFNKLAIDREMKMADLKKKLEGIGGGVERSES
ncbi:MAG: PAS domain-containing protein, partial [Candidatus Omnitrophota bacterium]